MLERRRQAEIAAQEKRASTSQMGALFNAYLLNSVGARNMAAGQLYTALTGQKVDAESSQALEQADRNHFEQQRQAIAAERQRLREQYKQQQEAISQQNKQQRLAQQQQSQQQADWQRSQEQARQQQEQQRLAAQHQQEVRQREIREAQARQPVNSCIYTRMGPYNKSYFANQCDFNIQISWQDQGDCAANRGCSASVPAGGWTSAGGGLTGYYEFIACRHPHTGDLRANKCN